MNWLSTNAPSTQKSRLSFTGCLILACVVPVILCQTQDKPPKDKHRNAVGSADTLSKESKALWTQHYKEPHYLGDPAFKIKSHVSQRRHKEGSQKLPKSHSKHKKQRRDRKKFLKDFEANQNGVNKNHINLLEPEKKYFDYFPIEDVNKNLTPLKEEDVEVVLLPNNTFIKERVLKSSEEPEKKQKVKRSKRGIPYPESYARPNYDYVRNFLASEQNSKPPVAQITNKIPQLEQYYSQGTPSDPWNNRFAQPLNEFYLPVPRPFAPASVPHIKYPIPGIYYNAVSPSGGHPVLTRPSNPSVGSRFGEDEDRVIWEIQYVGGRPSTTRPVSSGGFGAGGSFAAPAGTSATSGQFRPIIPSTRAPNITPTRAPPPPLIHSANRERKTTVQPQE